MPTIRTLWPAARRRRLAIVVTLVLMVATAAVTQATGSGARAQAVTSLPLMDTVTSDVRPRCARRKRAAAVN